MSRDIRKIESEFLYGTGCRNLWKENVPNTKDRSKRKLLQQGFVYEHFVPSRLPFFMANHSRVGMWLLYHIPHVLGPNLKDWCSSWADSHLQQGSLSTAYASWASYDHCKWSYNYPLPMAETKWVTIVSGYTNISHNHIISSYCNMNHISGVVGP